jgi:GDSL-like Lipase/Acylhydrolase family
VARTRSQWWTCGLGVGIACAIACAWLAGTAGAAAAKTRYYLAVGESLSTGGGATPGHSYVDDLFAFASRSIPGLALENLGCGGDTTTRMIHGGGLCHSKYQTGTQLGDAEAFLIAHRGQVAFVTIDTGGDDLLACTPHGTLMISPVCVQRQLATVENNLPIILSGLRAAGGNVPIVGLKYYDPFLAFYLQGTAGQQAARQSLSVLVAFNHELSTIYRRFHVKLADAQRAFKSFDWRPVGSYNGQTLPVNVANICNWTHMCQATGPNVHPNDTGHAILAATFESRLRGVLRRHRLTMTARG